MIQNYHVKVSVAVRPAVYNDVVFLWPPKSSDSKDEGGFAGRLFSEIN